ncbi:FAD/NAD-P-binding domain-containing protein [Artomyces pyxidatus]|uniref:FAD/NAD-P-binding domain-containing protein n=1 Tax=Artomyces pyxidatus TaxID=48021 RepID=A0ACB8TJF7_9AGAM|nr:FAD/NAD-P-binding domain-containing protein [Artomyces pyxidatus]
MTHGPSVNSSVDPRTEAVGIIGAGLAGLITAHTLLQDGFTDVVVLTRDRTVGGVWAKERVYPGLRVTSLSGELTFSSLEMPLPKGAYGDISGDDMRAYLECFAEKFLAGRIRFATEVRRIERGEAGNGWRVHVEDKNTDRAETLAFARIVLCSGGCSVPAIPVKLSPEAAKAANFAGPVLHSMDLQSKLDELHSVVTPDSGFVVVIGGGKSAQDAATYFANAGIHVTIVFEAVDCCVASWLPLPDFVRKSRFMSVMSPNIELNTRLERFLHTSWLGSKFTLGFWKLLPVITNSALGIPRNSPLRNARSALWTTSHNDERVPEMKRFYHLVKKGKISLAAPAHMERYGDDGKSVVLSDGRVLQADVVVLATGYASSWGTIFDEKTREELGIHRHPPTSKAKYQWNYKTLANPPPAHPDAEQQASSIFRGLVPAKNIERRDFAINGAIGTTNNGMTCEVSAHWISSYFLRDKMRIPGSVDVAYEETERDAAWMRRRYPDTLLRLNESSVTSLPYFTWPQAIDQLLEDMELRSMRTGGNCLTWAFKVVDPKVISTLKEERDAKRKKDVAANN